MDEGHDIRWRDTHREVDLPQGRHELPDKIDKMANDNTAGPSDTASHAAELARALLALSERDSASYREFRRPDSCIVSSALQPM